MKKLVIYIILLFLFSYQKSIAQICPMEIGFSYSIYVFSERNNYSFEELLGEKTNPMYLHIINVKDEETKRKIDDKCLNSKMESSIFIYASKDNAKTVRFCNQQDYVTALKNNISLRLEGE